MNPINSSVRVGLVSLLTVVILALDAFVPAEADPPSYPLVCRGGGGMTMHLRSLIEVSSDKLYTQAVIYFDPSPQPANTTPPRAGQCAWLDRGFRPGEPRTIRIRQPTSFEVGLRADGTWGGVVFDSRRSDTSAASLRDLSNAFRNGEPFQVHVRHDTRDAVLHVTRFGP